MRRIVLSAVALAAVFGSVRPQHPAHHSAMASLHSQPAVSADQRFAPTAPASSPLSFEAPAVAGSAKDMVPVGFGGG